MKYILLLIYLLPVLAYGGEDKKTPPISVSLVATPKPIWYNDAPVRHKALLLPETLVRQRPELALNFQQGNTALRISRNSVEFSAKF